MRIRLHLFLLFLLSSMAFHQTIPTVSMVHSESIYVIISQNDDFNSSQFILEIIETLKNEAQYKEGKLVGWPFRMNGPFEASERKYRGYNVGMAGIGSFLLNAYNSGYSTAQPILDEILAHFIENAAFSLTGGIYWGRFADEDTEGWTGMRYGVVGIIKFLSELTKSGYATELGDLISGGYTYLKSLQLDDGSWPMTEDGYITTGLQYGAGGIGNAMLDLYENLANESYLNEAINIGKYLIQQGIWDNTQFYIPWTPQSFGSEFDHIVIFGKSAGIAGLSDFFRRLYNVSGDQEFLDITIGIGNTLIEHDFGGFWANGSVSYVSGIYSSNIALTGYDVGTSGIAESLINIFEMNLDVNLLNVSARAEKFVLELINEDFSLPVGLVYTDNRRTGKNLGSAGLALLQLQLYEKFGTSRHYSLAYDILNHLYSLFKNNGNLPLDESDDVFGYSFNLEDGIAGIGNILLHFENVNAGNGNELYEEFFMNAKPKLDLSGVYFNTTSGNAKVVFQGLKYIFFISVIILKKIRRTKQNMIVSNKMI